MLCSKVQWRREGAVVLLMIRSRYQFSRAAGRVTLRRDEPLLLSVMVMMMIIIIIIQTVTTSHHALWSWLRCGQRSIKLEWMSGKGMITWSLSLKWEEERSLAMSSRSLKRNRFLSWLWRPIVYFTWVSIKNARCLFGTKAPSCRRIVTCVACLLHLSIFSVYSLSDLWREDVCQGLSASPRKPRSFAWNWSSLSLILLQSS